MRTGLAFLFCYASLMRAQPPVAAVEPVTESLHGVSITDPYRWLEDQDSPRTRAWVEGQMAYTRSQLAKVPQRERIRTRLRELMKIDVMGIPTARAGRYFFLKRAAQQSQFVFYMREAGRDTVLVDPNPMSADHTTSVTYLDISHDGKLVAYGLRQGGQDETTLAFLDVDARKDLPDKFPSARYFSAAILPDHSGVYYIRMLEQGPRLYYHAMGTDPARDPVVFGEGLGPTQSAACDLSWNQRWFLCHVYTGSAADVVEVYAQDLKKEPRISSKTLTPVIQGIDARFQAEIGGDRLYFLTNWQAPNGRILAAGLENPSRENWKEIVAERKSVLESFSVVGRKLAASWLEDVHSRVEIFDEQGKLVRELKLPSIGIASGPYGQWDSDETFYSFSSFGRPSAIYRYVASTGVETTWFQAKLPFDSKSVEIKQVRYSSKDGTSIPMFIAAKKGTRLDGSNPVLLTGYGGFNLPMLPVSSPTALAWLDMGGVYAVANLRGGGEFGEAWHKAGMLEKKQNVFDDFIAAAEYLIRQRYTRPEKLAISGGSNGGLLVGAVLTQRPELAGAVICEVPLLDMLRYDQFKVAKFWVPEYGTAQDPEQFKFLYKYSPYHHVDKGAKYPAVLMLSGDADTRVDPLHARKMAALLQASTASGKPVLLHYDTKGGHSGGLPVDRQIDNTTDELAFLAWQMNLK